MNESEQWALLWCAASNDIEVVPLERFLSSNRQAYRDGIAPPQAAPLYVGCRVAVEDAAAAIVNTLTARRLGKPVSTIF